MATPTDTATGCYVYGIVPGDVEITEDARGIKNGEIKLVRGDGLAALVSEVDISGPLGTPQDLQAHEEILDSTAAAAPVLPLRFGAVLTSEDAVVQELLGPHRDEFAQALDELEGRVQYVVKGRYMDQAVLSEILSENREAAKLHKQIRGGDPDATRNERIQLGEIINNAVEAKRQKDTRTLVSAMKGHYAACFVREPTHELDAAYVAFLIEAGTEDELGHVVADLGRDWDGRVQLRVGGPMAPWDFVDASGGAPS
jgi:Gas vesicle synthesis protein GvpL/GvpF